MIGWQPTAPVGATCPSFFGLRMRPVTLGHLVLLADIGIAPEEGVSFEDVLTAAYVCSGGHAVRRWELRRCWIKTLFRLWGRRCGKLDMADESARFVKWFTGQLMGPGTLQPLGARQGESAAPMHTHLMALARCVIGMSRREALKTTAAEIQQLVCAHGEFRGEMNLWTRQDERRRERSVALGLVPPRESISN